MFETAFIRLKWRCQQGCIPSRGHPHSLFVAPPSSKLLKISMLLTAHLSLTLTLLPPFETTLGPLDNLISRSLFIHLYKIPFFAM